MSISEKKAKRERALFKLNNQLTVLHRTATKKQKPVITQMAELFASL